MKLAKLSLAAVMAVGSVSALNAVSLEDAIKNVDFTGWLRYRYDTGSWDGSKAGGVGGLDAQSSITGKQQHYLKARLGAKADIGEGFQVFGQLEYAPQNPDGGYGVGSQAYTDGNIHLRQAYLQYNLADYGVSFLLGRQELGTIWTDDLVGMAAKTLYTGVEGMTFAAFAVDSFEGATDGDQAFATSGFPAAVNGITLSTNANFIFRQNMYGLAAIGAYDLGGSSLDTQIWLAYLNKRATFYALDVKYTLPLAQDLNWKLQATYLGNSLDSAVKNKFGSDSVANGNFFNLGGTIEGYGFDGTLGGMYYGSKGKTTINTIEDVGSGIIYAGKEIFYIKGSKTTDTFGQNTFAYAKAGYTLPSNVRIGAQFIYGGTKTEGATDAIQNGGGDKMEAVAEASYAYNKNLDFLLYYSYLDWKAKKAETAGADAKNSKNTVRFQTMYKF